MPIPDILYSSLTVIIQNIRELTRKLSPAQISDEKIVYWINIFMLYDMPNSLQQASLRTTFEFFTKPYQDVYETNLTDVNDPFYNFRNRYTATLNPFFCAGRQASFTQSKTEFYSNFPNTNFFQLVSFGNGSTLGYPGVINSAQINVFQPQSPNQLNVCLVRGQVLFSSIDLNGNGLAMSDTPINATIGNLSAPNSPPTSYTVQDTNNYINYITGQFKVTFPTAPGAGQSINSQCIPVAPALPTTLLWFDNKITLRPVPDQPYRCSVDAYIRPSELLIATDIPKISQWQQYIVYGAATKIFQMTGDFDSADRIAGEFKRQELLVGRATLQQQKKQRPATVFAGTNQGYGSQGYGFGNWGGNNI